jgi:hypothetical protein
MFNRLRFRERRIEGGQEGQPNDLMLRTAALTAVLCSSISGVYVLNELEPSTSVVYFLFLAPLIAVILWLQKDARRTGVATVQDWGFFLWLAWPLLIPWYAFKTRGRAGWRLLVGLTAIILSAYITAWVVALVAYGVKYIIWYSSSTS